MKLGIYFSIILVFIPLFCQSPFYIETDEIEYSYGQDIYITFNIHNTSANTFSFYLSVCPFSYYIDNDHFSFYSTPMGITISIPPDSTYSRTFTHTNFVDIGIHEIVGVFEVYNWFSNPVSITVESVNANEYVIISSDFQLSNHPNPFNPITEISFETTNLHEDAQIEIYNSRGQKINQFLISNNQSSITWDGTNSIGKLCPSGVYLYKLVSGEKELASNKMLLLK